MAIMEEVGYMQGENGNLRYRIEESVMVDCPLVCAAYCPSGGFVIGKFTEGVGSSVDVYSELGERQQPICFSDRRLWDVAAYGNSVIVTNDWSGEVSVYSSDTGAFSHRLDLNRPTHGCNGVSVNDGLIYVTSYADYRVRRVCQVSGDMIQDFIIGANPCYVSASGDRVAVSCRDQNKVYVYDSAGKPIFVYGSDICAPGSGDGQLHSPRGVYIDSQNRLFIADFSNSRIVVVTSSGDLFDYIPLTDHKKRPLSLTSNNQGKLYFTSWNSDDSTPSKELTPISYKYRT